MPITRFSTGRLRPRGVPPPWRPQRPPERRAGATPEPGAAAVAKIAVGALPVPQPPRPTIERAVDEHPVLTLDGLPDLRRQPRRADRCIVPGALGAGPRRPPRRARAPSRG